jgi:hypothetical protein
LKEISKFVKKQSEDTFMKQMLMKEMRMARIAAYQHRISAFVSAFQVSPVMMLPELPRRADATA